jgi:hypothetical protein
MSIYGVTISPICVSDILVVTTWKHWSPVFVVFDLLIDKCLYATLSHMVSAEKGLFLCFAHVSVATMSLTKWHPPMAGKWHNPVTVQLRLVPVSVAQWLGHWNAGKEIG